ncbi:alpha/beta hydrolase [Paraburkholderia dipogonis]|uniref:Alpha/beta hydrolase n=2 Tax=Paraburkholderia dipogonis TaxID=1211383 RepID=A0A4Y8MWP3_9BURK|nr:alpha/beta hydrolase [Paraburkholderia dipogonis]TFE41970.1 alpha/beta hydrolase [Paraburkholderia dipogonis]
MTKYVKAGVLNVAYLVEGPVAGPVVVLLHGFPYDVHAFSDVTKILVSRGCRVYVPYLRGFGPTRFVEDSTPRSGQQAAMASDLLAFLDALNIETATLAGFDWGGRIAALIGVLWPERAKGVVLDNNVPVQDIARDAVGSASPEAEHRYWYQYYMHSERGRAGLTQNRRKFCRHLWRTWSPNWTFDDDVFERSFASFENPDFVDIALHSYRHRYRLAPDDPAYIEIERRLQTLPPVQVPCIVLVGEDDGVEPPGGPDPERFVGGYDYEVVRGCGHNLPAEAPDVFAAAILKLVNA